MGIGTTIECWDSTPAIPMLPQSKKLKYQTITCSYGWEVNLTKHCVYGYWYNTNKTESLKTKSKDYHPHWFTRLEQCEFCGRLSTPKKVQYRSDMHGWVLSGVDGKITRIEKYSIGSELTTLCMGCWNKFRPIAKAYKESQEITKLINQLKREISKCLKSQKQAS